MFSDPGQVNILDTRVIKKDAVGKKSTTEVEYTVENIKNDWDFRFKITVEIYNEYENSVTTDKNPLRVDYLVKHVTMPGILRHYHYHVVNKLLQQSLYEWSFSKSSDIRCVFKLFFVRLGKLIEEHEKRLIQNLADELDIN